MHVTEKLNPGFGQEVYAASTTEWIDSCHTKLPEVLADLRTHLNEEGAQAVSKFTFSKGSAGIEREVYCAGWVVVGDLLNTGHTYHDLAVMNRNGASDAVAAEFEKLSGDQSR